jgi:hypothetical protein
MQVQDCVGWIKTKNPRRKKVLSRNNVRRGLRAPPIGAELPAKSSEKTTVSKNGAAESAAVDPDLDLIVNRWPILTPHAKATILGMVRKAGR